MGLFNKTMKIKLLVQCCKSYQRDINTFIGEYGEPFML